MDNSDDGNSYGANEATPDNSESPDNRDVEYGVTEGDQATAECAETTCPTGVGHRSRTWTIRLISALNFQVTTGNHFAIGFLTHMCMKS